MTPEQNARLKQGRLTQIASQELIPLYMDRREAIINRIISKYKQSNGEGSFLAEAAELSLLYDMTQQLIQSNQETGVLEEKYNAHTQR